MEKLLKINKVNLNVQEIVVGTDCAVLIVHGISEHIGKYQCLVQSLNKKNISTFAVDLRGHGKSGGKRGDIRRFSTFVKDVCELLHYIKQNYNFKKIGLFGHSMGGLISASCASVENVDFLILSNPVVYLPKKFRAIKFMPFRLFPFVRIDKKLIESKQQQEQSKKDSLVLKNFTIRLVGNMFCSGVRNLNKKLNITCPTLMMIGDNDGLLNQQFKSKEFFDKINTKNKTYKVYNAKHLLFDGVNTQDRVNDIIEWLNLSVLNY